VGSEPYLLGMATMEPRPKDHQYGRLHGVGAEPVQGFLAGLERGGETGRSDD
jgi:hypothetical protein